MLPLFLARKACADRADHPDPPMKYVSWALRILLFLLLLGFALKNAAPVTVSFYLGNQWEASLALVLLVSFGAGAVAGVLACLSFFYRQRREILRLRKELRAKPVAPEDAR
jgi:uncharacterized integral membrane protein